MTESATLDNSLDDLDRALIRELANDPRAHATALAGRLSCAESTVRRRMNRLFTEGLIRACIVGGEHVGGLEALIALQVTGDACEIADNLARHDAIKWVSGAIGQFDVFAWLDLADGRELGNFLAAHVNVIPGVERCETFIMLHHAKRWHECSPLPA